MSEVRACIQSDSFDVSVLLWATNIVAYYLADVHLWHNKWLVSCAWRVFSTFLGNESQSDVGIKWDEQATLPGTYQRKASEPVK